MKKMMYFIVVLSVMCLLGCPVSNYTINLTFDSNGGEGKVEPITKEIRGGSVDSYWEITLPYGNNLSKEGYYMCGWSVSPYGEKGNYLEGKKLCRADICDYYSEFSNITLYAIWRQVHTISIVNYGGIGVIGLIECAKYILGVSQQPIDECITVPYNYSGYYLSDCMIKIYVSDIYDVDYSLGFEKKVYPKSFNTQENGNGKTLSVYNFGDKPYITIEPDILGDDITLYAIW